MNIRNFIACFRSKPTSKEYSGVADFMINASMEEKISVFRKAAQKANEDQRQILKKAKSKN